MSAIQANEGRCSRVRRGVGRSRRNCLRREAMSVDLRPSKEKDFSSLLN